MTLPAALAAVLTAQLKATLEDQQPVGGGDISQTTLVTAGGRRAGGQRVTPVWLIAPVASGAGLQREA
ncbi:MAG TPA: hypothetical protein VL334_06315 [Anaerolineae bacterium]|nr:hypothetical protein [Anaerolineae bacterium]